MTGPRLVQLRALASDGTVRAERTLELGWTRVGGSEACGGPETAGTVSLVIQADFGPPLPPSAGTRP